MATIDTHQRGFSAPVRLHPLPVRIMHWVNAVAILIMIFSGLGIYNDEIVFGGLTFPKAILLGAWAPQYLQWHFLAMWVLVLNGLVYIVYGITTGRFRRKLFPVRIKDLVQVIRETLRFHVAHDDITMYNAMQKLLYIGVMLAVIVQVLSGLAIWKPVQFSFLADTVFFGFQNARYAHFFGMAAIVGFLVVHVALALLVPKTIVAMVTGGPTVPDAAEPSPPAPPTLAPRSA